MGIFLPGYYADHAATWLRKAIRESNKRVGRRQSWAEAVQDPAVARALDGMYDNQGQCTARDANGFACRQYTPHPYHDTHKNELDQTWKGADAQEGEPTDRTCPKCTGPMFRRKLNSSVMMYTTLNVAVCAMCHHHRRLPWEAPDIGHVFNKTGKKTGPWEVFELAEIHNDDGPVEINGQRFCYAEMVAAQEALEEKNRLDYEAEKATWPKSGGADE